MVSKDDGAFGVELSRKERDVAMCSIDLEPCSLWKEKEVTARKQHQCTCCGGSIFPKEPYIRHFSVFEGEASMEKCCMPCFAVGKEFLKSHGMRGTPSFMRTLLQECIEYEEDDGEMAERWRACLKEMDQRAAARESCAQ